jgi:hypothetical protein
LDRARTRWEQRERDAKGWMVLLGKQYLEQLLGENYERITSLQATRNALSASQQPMPTTSTVNRGVKRKAEPDVIDLTGY